jgi:hypothetical protein
MHADKEAAYAAYCNDLWGAQRLALWTSNITTETAITAADEPAEAERVKALDPVAPPPDPAKARAAMPYGEHRRLLRVEMTARR